MNIQHLESLSDVVAQITGVHVRERVPDIVLARADEVLLVDLAPAELIERLKEGKVYLPGNAQRAADGFFRIGNLTALRELALRRTADRVDDQMVDYLKQNAIEGPWHTAERLLVCVGPEALSEKVVRTAARLASGLNAPWLVVSIERADRASMSASAAQKLDLLFKLAESLGAETRRVVGSDFVDEILKLARREHVTQIVIGGRKQGLLRALFRKSLPDALIAEVAGVGVHVVTDSGGLADSGAAPLSDVRELTRRRFKLPWMGLGVSVIAVGVASLVGLAINHVFDLPNVSAIYLLAVLAAAVFGGYSAALAAALLSAVAYNFFFIAPVETFTIASPHEVVGLLIYVLTALIAGGLTSRIAEQMSVARARAVSTQSLYDFSRKLSGAATADEVVWAAVSQVRGILRRSIVFLLPSDGELSLSAAWPPDTELDVADMTAARWAFEKQEPAGSATATLPNSAFQFRPLRSPSGVVAGVIGYSRADNSLDAAEEQMLATLVDQTAIAIDRARLSRQSLDQEARLQGERFRSSLLSSISHDLKTPLATITGAVSSLRQLGDKMSPESRDDLLISIEQEGERLSRFVANLLDMTRIEAGTVNARRDWVDIADIVRAAVGRAERYFPGKVIETSIAPDLPLIKGDSVLLGQSLFNLIDNAIKYGGDEPISLYARSNGKEAVISVTDLGKGIPGKELDKIFEKFYRRGKADGRRPGAGLGLAIAKGFVEAMGGAIRAESPAQRRRGTRIVLRFPVDSPPGSAEASG